MRLTKLSPDSAAALAIETLHLDPETTDLKSLEGIATSLRRAASFMCPTSPGRLIDAVLGVVRPLSPREVLREDVADVLDQLIGAGDLLELRRGEGRLTRLLYLAPPSFIEREPGTFHLTGIRPFGSPIVEADLETAIEYVGHSRLLVLDHEAGLERLRQIGLRLVKKDRWFASPAQSAPHDLIDRFRVRLDTAGPAGQLDGLRILDPASSVRYYRGRWRSPVESDSGDFVARRPQAYGADLWCLIRVDTGNPQRLIEFPLHNPVVPGRDEAWRYQAAVDAAQGTPQRFRVKLGASAESDQVFDFFSPLPGFAERYVQFVGLPLGKTQGALFSYRVPSAVAAEVAAFLTEMLWMTQEEAPSGV